MAKKDEIVFDFGFTAVSENDLAEAVDTSDLEARIVKAERKARAIYDEIIPLLDNLRKDPDKEYIRWPNREDAIDKFQAKLEDILVDDD